ncbi:VPS10 domain-containing receptor SorCS2 isoform X1 [Lates japonicus]|uniref:VPS10 domain-containing receptor SorCS2 isoform X1 n=1 Tax=Lates japonicus TaxID=270547 RepID=A0AAD3QW39_LATJO|nr:VPS10 domain-containing receptor SorCS2 isoform X1 [Lates japonicus]
MRLSPPLPRWSEPSCSGTVHKTPPRSLIMGNLGSKLVEYKEEMYITSDCGKTWRQFTPEPSHVFTLGFSRRHHISHLDHGGVIVAIRTPLLPQDTQGRCIIWSQGGVSGERTGILHQGYLCSHRKPCQCTEKASNCDYGFERSRTEGDRCSADF